jgi:hypothetical protein
VMPIFFFLGAGEISVPPVYPFSPQACQNCMPYSLPQILDKRTSSQRFMQRPCMLERRQISSGVNRSQTRALPGDMSSSEKEVRAYSYRARYAHLLADRRLLCSCQHAATIIAVAGDDKNKSLSLLVLNQQHFP